MPITTSSSTKMNVRLATLGDLVGWSIDGIRLKQRILETAVGRCAPGRWMLRAYGCAMR
jgi:hypothetical protein